MKSERVAQGLGAVAILAGGYVWWQGRRIGLAVAGLGVTVLALSTFKRNTVKKLPPYRKPKPEPETLCSLLAAHRVGDKEAEQKIRDNYTSLKSKGYKSLNVEDVDTLIKLGYLEETTAKLNAMTQMPEAAMRHLLEMVLLNADKCVERILGIKLDRGEVSEDLRKAMAGYAERVKKCTLDQRFALAAMMQTFGCEEKRITKLLDSYLSSKDFPKSLAKAHPSLVTIVTNNSESPNRWMIQLLLACRYTKDGGKLILAAKGAARPPAHQIITSLAADPNFFHTLFGLIKDPLFVEVAAQPIKVPAENYAKAIAAGIDGPLAFTPTEQTVKQHKAWVALMLKVAADKFEWSTKEVLLKLDLFAMCFVPLIHSLQNEVWGKAELATIAPKVQAVVFFQMSEDQKKVVYPSLNVWVRGHVDPMLTEEEQAALLAK